MRFFNPKVIKTKNFRKQKKHLNNSILRIFSKNIAYFLTVPVKLGKTERHQVLEMSTKVEKSRSLKVWHLEIKKNSV